ncbi:MAG: hypothetical protein QM753_09130 [Thermomicrobiales bacterium]
MIGPAHSSSRLAGMATRGRDAWHALQVGAAIAIGQLWSADETGRRLREPYPIVRVANDTMDGFDPRERLDRLVLTEPLDLTARESPAVGMPGDAPN